MANSGINLNDLQIGQVINIPAVQSGSQPSPTPTKDETVGYFVTVSHSAPYGISDGATLMQSFFENSNIDYLSPQLYTTGYETQNDYAISQGVQWKSYATVKAAIVPSIVEASMYADAQTYFANVGVTLKGFVQWAQQ